MVYRRLGKKELELYFGLEFPEMDGMYTWQSEPITEKQKTFIHNLDINVSEFKYKGHASVAINFLLTRKEKGLATPKQAAFLIKANKIENIQTITKNEAGKIITKYISEHKDYNRFR